MINMLNMMNVSLDGLHELLIGPKLLLCCCWSVDQSLQQSQHGRGDVWTCSAQCGSHTDVFGRYGFLLKLGCNIISFVCIAPCNIWVSLCEAVVDPCCPHLQGFGQGRTRPAGRAPGQHSWVDLKWDPGNTQLFVASPEWMNCHSSRRSGLSSHKLPANRKC